MSPKKKLYLAKKNLEQKLHDNLGFFSCLDDYEIITL